MGQGGGCSKQEVERQGAAWDKAVAAASTLHMLYDCITTARSMITWDKAVAAASKK
jgi:hypothetical protein